MESARETVSVFAPATVANVGSAFDVLGFALEKPGDTVRARRSSTPGVTIEAIHGDDEKLSLDPTLNTAGVSASALLTHLYELEPSVFSNTGVTLEISKGLPIGSGLGSSSASTVAAVVAVNELLGAPLTREELLPFAIEGERVACGAAHADNVAPCLFGGFVLIRSYSPLDWIKLPTPSPAHVALVTPHLELRTSDARKVLKKMVPLQSAVSQWGNVAALIAGIYRNDLELMGRSLEDTIIEPERSQLIPGYPKAKQAAKDAGALGCSISGSGPSMFAFCHNHSHAEQVAKGMSDAFLAQGIPSSHYISGIPHSGAFVLEKR